MNSNDALRKDREIAALLYRTWSSFFSRFGRLTEVQRRAIPVVFRGQDVLLCAPTASGKTEAVCAPIIEKALTLGIPWKVLYVSPTRALVNDLYYRLLTPIEQMGLTVARYTGDHHGNVATSSILLTTPESFDSLLCRGKRGEGHLLANVTTLIIDEIHFLYGNPRGEQLRWLIHRLHRLKAFARQKGWIAESHCQKIALSATVASPEKIQKAFLDPLNSQIIIVPGGRDIELVKPDSKIPRTEDALIDYLVNLNSPEKILVFCNSRKRVDYLFDELKDDIEDVGFTALEHHGSLSKGLREDAEYTMKHKNKVVMFATSTLEIGVDIGDIDLIILDGPAPDVSTFLQRIGRGNRRTNKTRVMPCYGNYVEILIHSAIIDAARKGELLPEPVGPCLAVARQQLASYIFQGSRRRRRRSTLTELVDSCSGPVSAELIDHLLLENELIEDRSGIRLGEAWKNKAEMGDLHSNIESTHGTTIVDEDSGHVLAGGVKLGTGSVLKLVGNLMEVKRWEYSKVYVSRLRRKVTPDITWGYHSRSWVKGAGQPQAVKRYLGYGTLDWPVLYDTGCSYVFHLGGARRRAVIELIMSSNREHLPSVQITEWFLVLLGNYSHRPAWFEEKDSGLFTSMIADSLEKYEAMLGRPSANKRLPLKARIHEVQEWLDLENELSLVSSARWLHVKDEDVAFSLRAIIAANLSKQSSVAAPVSIQRG